METVIIEAEVPESVASALTHLVASEKAQLRRVVSAAVVEFAQATTSAGNAPRPDSWDSFLQQSQSLAVEGLPASFSVDHDHFLHGTPTRESAH